MSASSVLMSSGKYVIDVIDNCRVVVPLVSVDHLSRSPDPYAFSHLSSLPSYLHPNLWCDVIIQYQIQSARKNSASAQSCSCVEPSLAFATGSTSTHERVTWHGLYIKLRGLLCILVWQMRVSARSLEVTGLECEEVDLTGPRNSLLEK